MKKILLRTLTLSKFRAFEKFELKLIDDRSLVVGDNESGKSTLETALNFLLIGKNQNGMAELKYFKPMVGEVVKWPNEEYSVKAEFEVIDDINPTYNITLERALKQNFVRRRGSFTPEFTGHSVDYKVNGIAVTLNDYNIELGRLVNFKDDGLFTLEEVISLCMNINYFPNQINDKIGRQRDILFSIIPPISDSKIFEELNLPSDSLNELKSFIANANSLSKQKQHFQSKIRELEKQAVKLPNQITALEELMPDLSALDKTELEAKVIVINRKIDKLNQSVSSDRSKSAVELAKLQELSATLQAILTLEKSLNEQFVKDTTALNEKLNVGNSNKVKCEANISTLESKISVAEANLKDGLKTSLASTIKDISNLDARLSSSKEMMNNYVSDIETTKTTVANNNARLDELRNIGNTILAKEFTYSPLDACPTCERAFDEHEQHVGEVKAKELFTAKLSEDVAVINKEGISLKETNVKNLKLISEMEKKLDNNKAEISKLDATRSNLVIKKTNIEADIKKLEELLLDVSKATSADFDEIKELSLKLTVAKDELANYDVEISMLKSLIEDAKLKAKNNTELVELRAKKIELENFKDEDAVKLFEDQLYNVASKTEEYRAEVDALKESIALFKQSDELFSKIAQYEKEHTELTSEISKLENSIILIDKYNTSKLNVLDKELKKVFNYVSFQLYELQSNGEYKDVCNVVVNGRHYHKELNTASKINAGIEIVNAMQKHFGVSLPVFVDNAESVKDIRPTIGQSIILKFEPNSSLKIK